MVRRLLALAILACALPVAAIDARSAAEEYTRLQKWQFSRAVPLPPGGVTLARDTATWTLASGTVQLMQPAGDGTITGLVFEGTGRFTMTIPDRFELAQLRRFTGVRDLARIDQAITQLVVRTSDPAVARMFPAADAPYGDSRLARGRHEFYLKELRTDFDAAVLAALLNPGTIAFVADTKTADFDWMLYEYDSWRAEEITLSKHRNGLLESWVSLDRAEERSRNGRPGASRDRAALVHVDVRADLTRRGNSAQVSRHGQRIIEGVYEVAATYVALGEPLSALRLNLFGSARELKVTDETGAPLTVLRDHTGGRSALIENDVYDDDLVVVFPSPLANGQKRIVRFSYLRESANYARGGAWYPLVAEALLQRHTGKLQLTVARRNEARAMGRLDKRVDEEKTETTTWVIDRPTKMITFATATRSEEVKLEVNGIPPVIAFGPDYQIDNRDKVRNVGADVANSLQFFQSLLADKLDTPQMYVTSIAGNHGQAFDGFLHISEASFSAEHPGGSELFRAHETAHEWFGHKVGWSSYRDQWLSESFAEYTAMMFVQSFVKGGDVYFKQMLASYDGVVKGLPFAGGFSKFARPWLARMNINPRDRGRVGPLAHGWRANTSDIPGYLVQSYYKGPMVLHMLRAILGLRTGNDELFVSILRDYVRLASGKSAGTDDFRKIVEQRVGGDWTPFFNSWVYGAEIPAYRWRHEMRATEGGYELRIHLSRRDTSPDFMTIIPVRVEMENGDIGHVFIMNQRDEQSATFKMAAKPKKVVFAPNYSLLGTIERE